jgi:hypothetical protein
MWAPKTPITIAGYTLSAEEAWLSLFANEWLRLLEGYAETELITDLAIELLNANKERDPVEVARERLDRAGYLCG